MNGNACHTGESTIPGTNVMIFTKKFAEIISEKNDFFTQNKAKLFNNLVITLVFEKNTVKNRRKL
jgi:hypothetical protein